MAGLKDLQHLRAEAAGRQLALSAGLTHVLEEGESSAPTCLLLHGATVPHWEFDRLVPALHAAGMRTVRFDFYGHGLSDRPARPYRFALFLQQALEVLDGIDSKRPLTLLGHSFGAAVAAALAQQRPERIERLVLVAPLLDFMRGSFWPRVFALPALGRPLMRRIGLPALERRRKKRYAAINAAHLTPRFNAQARVPGYAEALASVFRQGTLGAQHAHYRHLHPAAFELRVIAGALDRVVPLQDVAQVRALLPAHHYLELAGAEHNLLLTHAAQVGAALDPKSAGPQGWSDPA